jgi:hypothetical protein
LSEGSSIARVFQEQIKHIIVQTKKEVFTNESFTDACARILAVCTKLSYLNMNQWINSKRVQLSLCDRSANVCCSAHLRTLYINVATFNDCLDLLDGRLDQLSSFTVYIKSVERSPTIADNQVGIVNTKSNLSPLNIVHFSFV